MCVQNKRLMEDKLERNLGALLQALRAQLKAAEQQAKPTTINKNKIAECHKKIEWFEHMGAKAVAQAEHSPFMYDAIYPTFENNAADIARMIAAVG